MNRKHLLIIALLLVSASFSSCFADAIDLSEQMKKSLVYLDISNSSFELYQPWRRTQTTKSSGHACAVGPYEVLTTAANVKDATLVQARRYGDSRYVTASVKVIDYEYNLCLLSLDKEAMESPLTPLSFKDSYPKGEQLTAYWLSSSNHLTTARATLDRAEITGSGVSFSNVLTFFASNVSRRFSDGQTCCHEKDTIGIAGWGSKSETGIIPSEMINRFLSLCEEDSYTGFAEPGFKVSPLLDPTMRKYLSVPEDIKHGVYVKDVYTLGTGSEELQQGDVILSINGKDLNPNGRYEHPTYKRIAFQHILMQSPVGDTLSFEVVRDGKVAVIDVVSKRIESDNMLIPYYNYGEKSEFAVVGGYVFQKMNRRYLSLWGDSSGRNAPPHFYNYLKNMAFKPSDDRRDIVILAYVLPAEINLGYQQLSFMIVDSVNGAKIKSMKGFINAATVSDEQETLRITFEMDSPTLIIPVKGLKEANNKIAQLYGIPELTHLNE